MLEIENQTQVCIDTSLLSAIAEKMELGHTELLLVDEKRMQELNLNHRGKNASTDVLSFPLVCFGPEASMLGSVVICVDVAQKAAEAFQHSLEAELALLFIHGALHLLGYDHEADAGEHREMERYWAEYFHLPLSLIART